MMTNPITLEQFSSGDYERNDDTLTQVAIDEEVNDGERSCILVETPYCCIPDLGVKIANGTMSYWNEEEKSWNGDFCLTLIYDIKSDNPQDYIYWEQDGAEITLWNWMRSCEKLDEEKFKGLDDLSKLQVYFS